MHLYHCLVVSQENPRYVYRSLDWMRFLGSRGHADALLQIRFCFRQTKETFMQLVATRFVRMLFLSRNLQTDESSARDSPIERLLESAMAHSSWLDGPLIVVSTIALRNRSRRVRAMRYIAFKRTN